jgi:hypothetical protein
MTAADHDRAAGEEKLTSIQREKPLASIGLIFF